jgi:hypothetical protein
MCQLTELASSYSTVSYGRTDKKYVNKLEEGGILLLFVTEKQSLAFCYLRQLLNCFLMVNQQHLNFKC